MKASKFELFTFTTHFAGMLCMCYYMNLQQKSQVFLISSQGSQEWLTDMNKLKVECGSVGHPVRTSPKKVTVCWGDAAVQGRPQVAPGVTLAAIDHNRSWNTVACLTGSMNTPRWMAMKRGCKAKLADWLKVTMDLEIDQDALIDIQSLGIFISIYWPLYPWCMWNYIYNKSIYIYDNI